MGWFKVDDNYFTHPKVWEAGEEAALLNLQGIAYCSANQTDGRIPHGIIARLTENPNVSELIERLLDAGLWRKTTKHYVIHDYLEHQSSRAQIRSRREDATKRKQRSRQRHGVTDAEVTPNVTVGVTAPDVDVDVDTDVDGDVEAERITPGLEDLTTAYPSMQLVARERRDQEFEPIGSILASAIPRGRAA